MRTPATKVFRRAGCGKSARPARRGDGEPADSSVALRPTLPANNSTFSPSATPASHRPAPHATPAAATQPPPRQQHGRRSQHHHRAGRPHGLEIAARKLRQREPAQPASATPAAAISAPCAITPVTRCRGCAPTASRMPNSRVRWLTENASTPATPTTAMASATAAKPPNTSVFSRSGVSTSARMSSSVAARSTGWSGDICRIMRVTGVTSA
jgi:hypothetical protein